MSDDHIPPLEGGQIWRCPISGAERTVLSVRGDRVIYSFRINNSGYTGNATETTPAMWKAWARETGARPVAPERPGPDRLIDGVSPRKWLQNLIRASENQRIQFGAIPMPESVTPNQLAAYRKFLLEKANSIPPDAGTGTHDRLIAESQSNQASSFWLGADAETVPSKRNLRSMTIDEAEAYRRGYEDGLRAAQTSGCEVSWQRPSEESGG